MNDEVKLHQTSTEMARSVPAEVDAGTDLVLDVKVSCSSTCDLQGKTVRIAAQDGTLSKDIALFKPEGGVSETGEFSVKAPARLGECSWRVVFPEQDVGGVIHEESSTHVTFTVKPHKASIVEWDYPAPGLTNSTLNVKVGVKCSAGCPLGGSEIELYDERGTRVATGMLGKTVWPGTRALYWTDLGAVTPAAEGVYSWTVKFPGSGLESPHEAASSNFSLRIAVPPEQIVTVEVIDKATMTPIKNARVVLYPYSGYSDEHGIAKVGVPRGEHKLQVMALDHLDFQTTIEVAADLSVRAELSLPTQRW